jgi:hypothetical protein
VKLISTVLTAAAGQRFTAIRENKKFLFSTDEMGSRQSLLHDLFCGAVNISLTFYPYDEP